MAYSSDDLRRMLESLSTAGQSEGNDIGKMIASGIGVGIDQNSYLAITAMDNVYVELDKLSKDAAKNAEALAKKRQARELKNLKNSRDLELISEQEYYEKLRDYRDTHLRQGSDDWYKYTEEIIKYNKRLADEAEKEQERAAEEAAKRCAEMLARVEKLQEDLRSRLGADDEPWAKTTRTIIRGIGNRGLNAAYTSTHLADFSEQIENLERYRDTILALRDLGDIPDDMFAEIGKMDLAEGLRTANIILNSSAEERARFISGYSKRGSLADEIAAELNPVINKKEFENLGISSAEAFNSAYFKTDGSDNTEFVKRLLESFDSVPESYRTLGENSAASFGEGFFERLPGIAEEIRSRLSAAMSGLGEELAARAVQGVQTASGGNTYNNTYTFNSSRDTTTEQLFAARRAATLERLRGNINK